MSNAFSHLRASVWPRLLTSESIRSIGFFALQSIEKSGFSYEQQTALQKHSAPKEANSKFWYFIRQRTCVWRPQDGHDQLAVCISTDTHFLLASKWRQPEASPRAYDVWLAVSMMNCFPVDNHRQKRFAIVAHVSCKGKTGVAFGPMKSKSCWPLILESRSLWR